MKKLDLGLRGLLAVGSALSGVGMLTKAPPIVENLTHLTVPLYYMPYFGVMKVLGALGLLSTLVIKTPVLREGAQWGFLLYYAGAAATHLLAGDSLGQSVAPLVLTLLSLGSLVVFQQTRSQA
jgi:hypothetical protein